MSLYFGNNIDSHIADIIASIGDEQKILEIIDELVEPEIGTIRLLSRTSTKDYSEDAPYNSNDIMNYAQAKRFSNGWVYANGKRISKAQFPRAYDILKTAGCEHDESSVCLPDLKGFLFGAGDEDSNLSGIYQQKPQEYSMPKHKHVINMDALKDPDKTTVIKNASWVYSTKSYGNQETSIAAQTFQGYDIPHGIPTMHGGHSNSLVNNILIWDMPLKKSSGSLGTIETMTGQVENITAIDCDVKTPFDSEPGYEAQKIAPKHVIVNAIIYIGRPKE